MTRYIWRVSAVIFLWFCAGNAFAERPLSQFNAYLDGLVQGQFHEHDLAGMTFVLIKGGQVVAKKGYGYANLETLTPVDPNRHLFRPGSVSKLFTWTAVMQLVEQGRLNLDADVGEYVDQFDLPNAFDAPLTLRHILSHTPGLEDGAAGYLFGDEPADNLPLAEALETYRPNQVRAPGTYASYSNWATALAGLIVANVSGQSFESYVQEHILDPLGMVQATFEEPLPDAMADDMATGYVEEKGMLTPFTFEYIKSFGPAGAMSSSAAAMAPFIQAHLNGGEHEGARILSAESTELMHSVLFRHDERVAAMAHGFYEIWRNGQRFIGHGGDTIAFHSQLVIDPERKFGFFLSFNSPGGTAARSAIVRGVIDFFYPAPEPRYDYAVLEGGLERAQRVAGSYRMNRRSFTKLEGIIALVSDITVVADGPSRIHVPVPDLGGVFAEVEPYVYEKIGTNSRIVFETGDDGAVGRAFLANTPIIVADRIAPWETGGNHQLIILLTLLASLFVVINTIRNRALPLDGAALNGRRTLTLAAAANLAFIIGLGAIAAGMDMNRVVFDFPPPGTALVLGLPIVSLICTGLALLLLIPVWRSDQCGVWARVRYTYVCIVFVLFLLILSYWNLIGWNYY